jgi:hypothetical protein
VETREWRAAEFHHSESDGILVTGRFELKAFGDSIVEVLGPECSYAAVHVGQPYESESFVACEDVGLSKDRVWEGEEACHGLLT